MSTRQELETEVARLKEEINYLEARILDLGEENADLLSALSEIEGIARGV